MSLGILVGEENWTFFKEIYDDLANVYPSEVFRQKTYRVPLLRGMVSRRAFQHGIRAILRRNDICFFEWASDLLMTASHMPKTCVIVTRLHSFELYEWAPHINWDRVDRVILVSDAMRQLFIEQYPSCANRTSVVCNGVALDRFRPRPQHEFSFKLGMLCGIMPIKRVYEVILMHYGLRQAGYPAQLHIAGEPDGDRRYAVAVHRLITELKLEDSVMFHGFVPDTQRWLQGIDIFISNSFWEGQQVALLEAMASGCHCLSHAWSGAEEILPSDNLFMTEAQLHKKIVAFASMTAAEQAELTVQLRSIACDRFDINRTKSEVCAIIAQSLAGVAGAGQKGNPI